MKSYILNIACIGVIINIILWGYLEFHTFSTLNPLHFAPNAPKTPIIAFIWTKADIVAYIAKEAVKNDLNPVRVLRIAQCESQFDYLAKNKKNSARGLFQINKATEEQAEKNLGKEFDVFKPEDNLEIAFYFMKKGQFKRQG